jgi:hypothetical protein
VDRVLGPNGREGIDGHPEVEMALVELYRVTGERRYLDLAARMVDLRGTGILGNGRFGPAYWQDHERVSEATSVAGHAVRQLYLDSGAVDVATELGDTALLEAVHRRWQDMVATRTYLTGGVGSRHKDEAFGDPFELPPDRAYAETCGSIASVMLAWRLLLATGDPACADLIERTIYNGVLAGVSLDGDAFFYENPLQRRTVQTAAAPGHGERASWYPCACCPPNLMRIVASWEQYLATTDELGIQVHQYADSVIEATTAAGTVRLRVETGYPWSGDVKVVVLEAPEGPWSLALRVPSWAHGASASLGADGARPIVAGTPWESGPRVWRPGETIRLDLAMEPRVTAPDPRIDALRGCVALERGPLVYCLETVDLPGAVELETVYLAPDGRTTVGLRPDLGDGVVGLTTAASHRAPADQAWPYGEAQTRAPSAVDSFEVQAIPYFTWANRGVEAMRVWIPVDRAAGLDAPQ